MRISTAPAAQFSSVRPSPRFAGGQQPPKIEKPEDLMFEMDGQYFVNYTPFNTMEETMMFKRYTSREVALEQARDLFKHLKEQGQI